MRFRIVPILAVAALAAAAVFAAVTANPASGQPNRNSVCSACHSGAPSGTLTAAPSTTTPAAGASYNVAINIGLTASGDTGYHIAETDASGTSTVWTTVLAGGPGSVQTSWTAIMTAPASPGTYYYKVWGVKGPADNTGMAQSVTYSITVPAPPAVIGSLTPASGLAGSSVTIAGSDLGSSGMVNFDGIPVTPTSWSASSITFTVPIGATTGLKSVSATPTGGSVSNALNYNVTAPPPAISSLSPSSGLAGSSFTITGSNFGASGPSNTVSVGGTAATTTSWSASSITVTVPANATVGAKAVVVTSGGQSSGAATFTVNAPPVTAPIITSLTPSSGLAGSSFTIAGSNFGASGPSNTVSVGGITAATTSWSATSITVTVPANATVGAKAVIVTSGGQSSAAATFTVNAPIPVPVQAPSISSLSPESGLVGSSLTITGTDFGAGGTVSVGGANAIITAWNDNAITVTVPADLTAGAQDVTVTSGGLTSVAVTFTVNAPQDPPNGTDTTPPTTTASGVDDDDWYNHAILIHLTATDNSGGSGVASITYSVDGGAPITVSGSTATVIIGVETEADDDEDAPEHGRDGAHSVTYFATDNAGNVELAHTLRVNTDTERPSTEAPRSSRVRRNQTATLSYRITDATPNGGTANVHIFVKNRRGDVVKQLTLNDKPVNTPLAAAFKASLRPGTYTFRVYGTDRAGNAQSNTATNTLTVASGS